MSKYYLAIRIAYDDDLGSMAGLFTTFKEARKSAIDGPYPQEGRVFEIDINYVLEKYINEEKALHDIC